MEYFGRGRERRIDRARSGKWNFPFEFPQMEFHRWIPRTVGNEGEKLAGIFDHDDPPEFHFSENVVRTFAPRAY